METSKPTNVTGFETIRLDEVIRRLIGAGGRPEGGIDTDQIHFPWPVAGSKQVVDTNPNDVSSVKHPLTVLRSAAVQHQRVVGKKTHLFPGTSDSHPQPTSNRQAIVSSSRGRSTTRATVDGFS